MEFDEILSNVIEIVEEVLEESNVTAESHMQDDLEIESLEFYELLGALENGFRIKMPEKILAGVDTVEDIAIEVERLMKR